MSTRILLALVAVAFFTCRCTENEPTGDANSAPAETRRAATRGAATAPATAPSTQMTTLTGTLQGGMMAIGGETTGWTLAGDGAVGGVELDVSRVQAQATRLEGKRVTVSGRMFDKKYVERGTVRMMRVEKITEAR